MAPEAWRRWLPGHLDHMLGGSSGNASAVQGWRMMSGFMSNRVMLVVFASILLKVKIYLRPLHLEVKMVFKHFCSSHCGEGCVKSLCSQLQPL